MRTLKAKGKRAPAFCQIGKVQVPLRGANWPTLAIFRAGEHGRMEAGVWCFWTAVLKRPVRFPNRSSRHVTGRAFATLPPGERFDRIRVEARTAPDPEERKHDRLTWAKRLQRGYNVAYVRPASLYMVKRWIGTHESDARHISHLVYRGRILRPKEWR